MKTQRLYYQDAYQQTFTAQVVERLTHAAHPAVVLDQTAFYPTGGGQPHDVGTLNHTPVLDVVEREADGAIVHVLAAELEAAAVTGQLDWPRRFDYMQQHTGQHILSQAMLQVAGAATVGFHLTPDNLTIDVDRAGLKPDTLAQAQAVANQVIFANRPVRAQFVTPEELARLPLRKPPKVDHDIRIVQVEGFDWSPCGGTHVASAGQIGLIKIIKAERRGAETRLEFICGGRAVADYDSKHAVIQALAGSLSTGYAELPAALDRLHGELQDTRKKLAALEQQLLLLEVDQLLAAAPAGGAFQIITHAWFERDQATLRLAAKHIIAQPGRVALLGAGGAERSALVFARSADVALDVAALLRAAITTLGGKGGGAPDLAQGGGGPATLEQVQTILAQAASQLERA
jgi:alanyl-tRNA synthetase